jgi:hypothetical protein
VADEQRHRALFCIRLAQEFFDLAVAIEVAATVDCVVRDIELEEVTREPSIPRPGESQENSEDP